MTDWKTLRPGWTYFHCEACGASFEVESRSNSPSGEDCLDCDEFLYPLGFTDDPAIEVDRFGNLVKMTLFRRVPVRGPPGGG